MKTKADDYAKGKDVDYDRLWAEAEKKQKKEAKKRLLAWVNWSKKNEGQAPYSAWLVMPSGFNDYGVRPLPSGTPYWASPFISVQSPDPFGQPLAEAENFLFAQVFNLGAASAAPTKVDFLWADPSVGLGPADFTLIGTEWIEVQPLTSKVVKCTTPWTPTYLNNGHECVIVNCDNHILDPIRAPFQPWIDRHVGQRNFAVLPAVPQPFSLWAPLGFKEVPAEIRILALKGVAPEGFAKGETAYATLSNAMHEVLRVLHPFHGDATGVGGANKKNSNLHSKKQKVLAKRIAVKQVLRSIHESKETRPLKGYYAYANQTQKPEQGYGTQIGALALKLTNGYGTAARIELDLHPLELAFNEIVILAISHVANGLATGGYVIALANPNWF